MKICLDILVLWSSLYAMLYVTRCNPFILSLGPADCPGRVWPCTEQVCQPRRGRSHRSRHSRRSPGGRRHRRAAAGCHAPLPRHRDARGRFHKAYQPQHHHSHQKGPGRMMQWWKSETVFQTLPSFLK